MFECARRLDLVMEVENITDEISTVEVEPIGEPSHPSALQPPTNHDLSEFPAPTTFVLAKMNSGQLPPGTEIGHPPTLLDVSSQIGDTEGIEHNYISPPIILLYSCNQCLHFTVLYILHVYYKM